MKRRVLYEAGPDPSVPVRLARANAAIDHIWRLYRADDFVPSQILGKADSVAYNLGEVRNEVNEYLLRNDLMVSEQVDLTGNEWALRERVNGFNRLAEVLLADQDFLARCKNDPQVDNPHTVLQPLRLTPRGHWESELEDAA